jgi:hypothetical protein
MHAHAECPVCLASKSERVRLTGSLDRDRPSHAAATLSSPDLHLRRLRVLARFAPCGALLTILPGQDGFARSATQAGWRVTAAGITKTLAAPLLREGLWPAGSFDAVALCGTLEAVLDPEWVLHLAAHYCRLDGLLLVETWDGEMTGTAGASVPRCFTRAALTTLLARVGFRPAWMGRFPGPETGPEDAVTLCAVAHYAP